MGMYTQLNLHVRFNNDTPVEIINLVRQMAEPTDETQYSPIHPFIKHGRARFMLRCGSYYHTIQPSTEFWFDEISNQWVLNTRCDFKNYDNEIDNFLAIIEPHVEHRGFAGFKLYEEDEHPTLIYFNAESVGPEYKNVV